MHRQVYKQAGVKYIVYLISTNLEVSLKTNCWQYMDLAFSSLELDNYLGEFLILIVKINIINVHKKFKELRVYYPN